MLARSFFTGAQSKQNRQASQDGFSPKLTMYWSYDKFRSLSIRSELYMKNCVLTGSFQELTINDNREYTFLMKVPYKKDSFQTHPSRCPFQSTPLPKRKSHNFSETKSFNVIRIGLLTLQTSKSINHMPSRATTTTTKY